MTEIPDPNSNQKTKFILPVLFSMVLIIGLWLGSLLSKNTFQNSANSFHQGRANDKINSLIDYIEYQYVDTINKKDLVEKTIASLLQNLDPHSSYIPAADFSIVNEPLEGNFDGIGVEFNIINDTIRVITPIQGGPSEKIGIKSGDKIILVEGKKFAGIKITNKEVFTALRGKKGSIVTVSIMRSGIKELLKFKITRDAIPLYSLDSYYMLNNTIGYIKISKFSATTYDEYLNAFNDLSTKGMRKLILDLRGNPGGYLTAAVDLCDEFLSKGLQIVYTQGKANPRKTYKATDRGSFENNPLVILIDEGSASASEIVAGAVQDNDRGTIIGRRSFGKGLVQDQLQLPDGSAIRLTIARYYTPTGRCIQKPYDNADAYETEEYERYTHGELLNEDSVKLDKSKTFITANGKKVYGGGGIMPDIFVPIDTAKTNTFVNKAFYMGAINTFAFEYTDKNRKRLNAFPSANAFIENFEISPAINEEFFAYCTKLNLQAELKDKAKIIKSLNPYLKALIGRNMFDKDAYYPIINQGDNSIMKAVEYLEKEK